MRFPINFSLLIICMCILLSVFCTSNIPVHATNLDYSRLNTAIQQAPYCSNLDGRYSRASWDVYAPILSSAMNASSDASLTQVDIDNITNALVSATAGLVYMTPLRTQLSQSAPLLCLADNYSPLTFDTFTAAYQRADGILLSYAPTTPQVQSATSALLNARLRLLNVTHYHTVLDRVPASTLLFTQQSFARVRQNLSKIETALADNTTTQELLDTLVYDLDASISGLVYLANPQPIQDALAHIQSLNITDYSTYSRRAITQCIGILDDALHSPELTENQSNIALNHYHTTLDNLVDISALLILIEESSAISGGKYTPSTFLNLQEKLLFASQCVSDEYCTQLLVNDCIQQLQSALDTLIVLSDKNQLLQYIQSAQNLLNSGLNTSNATMLSDCINMSTAVYMDEFASIDEVSLSASNILSLTHLVCVNELDIATSKSLVLDMLNYIDSLNASYYTSTSWQKLQYHYRQAQNMLQSNDVSLLTLEQTLSNLNLTTDALLPNADTTNKYFVIALSIVIIVSIVLILVLSRLLYIHITKPK
ncbi:MAG: hypothetical protein IKC79_03770 [Clostridia bacterium]|nr:hypothetical protein [Clostridia bacterium]